MEGVFRKGYTSLMLSMCCALRMSLMPMMFSWRKRSRILISRSVRWQYVWCSNGLIFLMATRWFVLLSRAELVGGIVGGGGKQSRSHVTRRIIYNEEIKTLLHSSGIYALPSCNVHVCFVFFKHRCDTVDVRMP